MLGSRVRAPGGARKEFRNGLHFCYMPKNEHFSDGIQWHTATGWSCYTCKGHTQSDTLANCLYEAAIKNFPGRRIRTDYSDKDPDWEENFYLLRKTLCAAVLSENYFMDNKSDLEYLQSRAVKQTIIDTHVEGIIEYLEMNS